MTYPVSPFTIRIMFACYYSADPQTEIGIDGWTSPAGVSSRAWLSTVGLIDQDDRSTPKGEAWVRLICETPLPVQQWVPPTRDARPNCTGCASAT